MLIKKLKKHERPKDEIIDFSSLFPVLFGILAFAYTQSTWPNTIVFLVDDYDKYETSPYGGNVLTHNLDRLAKAGMIFHNTNLTSTVCTPSGYIFLTGSYSSSSRSNKRLPVGGVYAQPIFQKFFVEEPLWKEQ